MPGITNGECSIISLLIVVARSSVDTNVATSAAQSITFDGDLIFNQVIYYDITFLKLLTINHGSCIVITFKVSATPNVKINLSIRIMLQRYIDFVIELGVDLTVSIKTVCDSMTR